MIAVVGPPGSGRSTALETLATQARAAGVAVHQLSPTAHAVTAPGQPTGSAAPSWCESTTAGERPTIVLLDDLEEASEPLRESLAELADRLLSTAAARGLDAGRSPGIALAVSADVETMAGGFRGLPASVRRGGAGILLCPGRTDARDVFGVRHSPRQLARLPGRGLLVRHGRACRVQTAVPGPNHLPFPLDTADTERPPGGADAR